MPRAFWRATAEGVVAAIDACFIAAKGVDDAYVASFTLTTTGNAKAALDLAVDLKLLKRTGSNFLPVHALCRAFASPDQHRKAAALRVILEDYEPFLIFRERLESTRDATAAARHTKQLLDLDLHQDDVKDTLLSLGQYSQAISAEGAGIYRATGDISTYDLAVLATGCEDDVAAERLVRERLGLQAAGRVSRDEVLVPLTQAIRRARGQDGRGAVVVAGNAVESYLAELAGRLGVSVAGRHGINAKVDALSQAGQLPTKLKDVSKYLGHIRNAADHGIDAEVGTAWNIRASTGLEYVFVACSFICAVNQRELGGPHEI